MIVDTSALMAILLLEPEAPAFARAVERAQDRLISAVSVLEASLITISRRPTGGLERLDRFIATAQLAIAPFDADQIAVARDAFERFGKGRHPAALNFGDCAVYALAASRGMPLLCKGSDFARTDIAIART